MNSDQPSALERRRLALEKIDNAKFSWYHVRYGPFPLLGFKTNLFLVL
jgi:hypothetical protein